MENKKVISNIFDSVVAEPAVNAEAVAFIKMLIAVVPVADDNDLKGCGLNR